MSLLLYPYSENLLAHAATRCLKQAAAQRPDLSGVVLLVTDAQICNSLRAEILTQAQSLGHDAVLGLRITTLPEWVQNQSADLQTPLSDPGRRLVLVEALRQHSSLFGEDDPWRIADSLLELFDELTLHQVQIPDTEQALAACLARGYGIQTELPAPLSREAHIVHRLWSAWQEQTAALQRPDPRMHYRDKLLQQLTPQDNEPFYILVGLQADTTAERAWISARLQRQRAEWLLHGSPADAQTLADRALQTLHSLAPIQHQNGDRSRCAFLDSVYPSATEDLRSRAQRLAAAPDTRPQSAQLNTLTADSAEQEARAIDLQVRRWLLAGKQGIGIITEDRRLARRVRALLERAGILLQDAGGWALSTTSAAACVERWLQSVEEDFAHQPLLDFLKSSLACTAEQRSAHLASVYRLEHDIIQHENIARGLERYRRQIEYRRRRLNWPPAFVEHLHALLDRLTHAAFPLLQLRQKTHPASAYLAALRDSLDSLGVWAMLDKDAAGQRIIALWEELDAAAHTTPLQLHWQEFRTWLGQALEDKTFRPSAAPGPVHLLTLAQSQAMHFDALVCGACDREHLPGKQRISAFFNAGVRRELGLPTWESQLDQRRYQFRHVLECAPEVLLTWRREEQGEPVLPSPWLEALEALHQLAYAESLENTELKTLVVSEQCTVQAAEHAALPEPPSMPRPCVPAQLLPGTISASRHQHLIDCPYRYFASDCLELSPADEVRESLQKSDYGERVHRCLEAFHSDVERLPGPFTQAFTADTRAVAIRLMEHIATAVFAHDLEDNFQHRGWLKRWQALIPGYIDWQIEHATQWRVQQVEVDNERAISAAIALRGRLDRIDSQGQDAAIIDYKTGTVPSQADIESGEAVQLPFYALLSDAQVVQVEYLQLDKTVRSAGRLAGDELIALRDAIAERLDCLQQALADGQALPAWGDANSCRYCPMQGVCRRAAWIDDVQPQAL